MQRVSSRDNINMDETSRRESGQSSTDTIPESRPPTRQLHDQQPPAGSLPPPPLPPPAIGYPPAMGYPPGYQPNQQNYHQLPPLPPAEIYYGQPPPYRQGGGKSNSGGFLFTTVMFFFFSFGFAITIWLILRPKFPIFHVGSFSVTDFNIENNNFTSAWDANLVIENKYMGDRVQFDRIQSFIYFDSNNLLVSSNLDSPGKEVTVKSNENGMVNIKLSTGDHKQSEPPLDKRVMDEMRDKRKTGKVLFALKIFAWTKVESGVLDLNSRYIQLRISCNYLKVQFEGNSRNGNLKGKSKDCEVDL